MTKRTWYRVALARPDVVRLVASSGEHMGQAIAEAVDHLAGSWPVAVDNAPEEVIPLGESVGKGHVIMLGDAPPNLPTFRWPTGVLPALDGAPALAAVRPGWIVRSDPKLLVIEAQTDEEHIIDLFLGLIEKLPSADNLEVRVQPHFEDAPATHVWLTSRVNAKKILRFLDDHDVELIGNGHLELAVYVRAHKATLRLTEHKTVVWIAEDGALKSDVERWLGELGVPRVDSLTTIGDASHFHYRPAKSRDRKKLEEELYRQRLRKVATEPKT